MAANASLWYSSDLKRMSPWYVSSVYLGEQAGLSMPIEGSSEAAWGVSRQAYLISAGQATPARSISRLNSEQGKVT